MILSGHLRLDVPFEERETAKALGARPYYKEGNFVCWFVTKGTDVMPFVAWWNESFVQSVLQGTLDVDAQTLEEGQAALMAQAQELPKTTLPLNQDAFAAQASVVSLSNDQGNQAGEGVAGTYGHPNAVGMQGQSSINHQASEGVSLSRYLQQVKGVVSKSFSTAVWVMVDVISITGREGSHRYLELAEYDERGNEVAKSRGMLWARDANVLLRRFEASTGVPLSKGMKALLLVKPQVSERYGLSLKIENIDPRFTVGEMEAKLMRIRQQIQAEGLSSQYQRIYLPLCYERVAVIAPEGAAGLGDFNTQADVLQAVGLCQFTLYPAYFQGDQAKTSLVKAFSSIAADQASGIKYDAIVIIRGGGDTAGLMALNELEIVRAVCQATLPVMVGIGHERDTTLLDEYGAQRFATPSMVINSILRDWMEHGESVRGICHQIQKNVEQMLVRSREGLLSQRQRVQELLWSEQRRVLERLASTREQLQRDNQQTLSQLRHVLRSKRHEIAGVSPSRILSMGYAYVIEKPGRTIPTSKRLSEQKSATLRMQDGDIKITINQ